MRNKYLKYSLFTLGFVLLAGSFPLCFALNISANSTMKPSGLLQNDGHSGMMGKIVMLRRNP